MFVLQNNKTSKSARAFPSAPANYDFYRNVSLVMPILFGIWSVMVGADYNWDLRNYHLYNPFALFNGKLNIDLAPGGFQNYFNPVLDIPFYLALQYMDPRAVAFLSGTFHGLNFILLFYICHFTAAGMVRHLRPWVPFLLAAAGSSTGNFISELGNTMGDNTTAVFCLAAVLAVLYGEKVDRSRVRQRLFIMLLSGFIMGLGVGLKLTNAPYAIALFAGLLALEGTVKFKLLSMTSFGIGVLVGVGVTGGYWFYTMWLNFGNPFFPQFGSIFPNPLVAKVNVADTTWVPKGALRNILWPFLISANSKNAGQIVFFQIVWAIVYPLLIIAGLKKIFPQRFKAGAASLDGSARFILVAIVTGFVIWMRLFGIYRYLIPMDLLAPLAIFILLNYLMPEIAALHVSKWFVAVSIALTFVGGIHTWEHARWTKELLNVEVPPLPAPEKTTVIITEGTPPWSWIALKFPVQVAFIQINGNFPQGPGFHQKVEDIVKQRAGPVYALFKADDDALSELSKNIGTANHAAPEKAQDALERFGWGMVVAECKRYRAGIGASTQVYQWCPVQTAKR